MKRIIALFFVLSLCASVHQAAADNSLPDDGYDYAGALEAFKADYAAKESGTFQDWDGERTMSLKYLAGPYIKNSLVMGSHQMWQKKVFNNKSEHSGRTVEQSVGTWYDPANPGTYLSLGELKKKYPQFEGKKKGGPAADPFEKGFNAEMKTLQTEIDVMNHLKNLAQDEYRTSLNSSPEGKKPVVIGEDYAGEEFSLTPSLNVPAALEKEERRKRENSLLRRISDLDAGIARLTALKKSANDAKAELKRLAALDPKDIVKEREEFLKQADYYEAQYTKAGEKLFAANREKTLAINEAGIAAAMNATPDAKDAKALMTSPEATTAVDKMRKASDKYDAAAQEREFFLKTSREYRFKAEFYKLAERIAAGSKKQ